MKSILVVDGSTNHARNLADALTDAGFHTIIRHDTDDLLAFVQRHRPDAILLDEFMPSVAGQQALRELARNPATRPIPVVMLAPRSHPADKVRALWQGARDYLVKPVDARRLVRLINALLIDGIEEPRLDVRLG